MIFTSFTFLVFFLLLTPLYYLTPHRLRWLLLLVASCYFYAYFIPAYILILFAIIGIDYIAGRCIAPATGNKRKAFLILSLTANLGVLAIFKYHDFFVQNVNHLLAIAHIHTTPFPLWRMVLPLGLSFHTFQAMSYTLEVYKGRQEPERHPGIYALYVMFYPQLVAGPIERPGQLLHQFYEKHEPDYPGIADGLKKMLWGFFMKVVVADRLSIYVDFVDGYPAVHGRLALLIASFFFAFQIYCDFAGYSLIAIGAAKTMGFTLAENFNRPFLTNSVIDFWRRWHISLSRWFNDYLYTPIIIEKRHWGKWAIVYGVFITFFFSGLWHGAAWAFVVWGLLHGLAMSIEFLAGQKRRSKKGKKPPRPVVEAAKWLLTFTFLCFTWIFFRAGNMDKAMTIITKIIDPHTHFAYPIEFTQHFTLICSIAGIATIALADIIAGFYPKTWLPLYHPRPAIRMAACTTLIVVILLFGVLDSSEFIYFQF
jgi:alginate O-acetyltransferase complex protein AlgI